MLCPPIISYQAQKNTALNITQRHGLEYHSKIPGMALKINLSKIPGMALTLTINLSKIPGMTSLEVSSHPLHPVTAVSALKVA